MKHKKFKRKLTLSKETIATLDQDKIRGGRTTTCQTDPTCNCPDPTQPVTCCPTVCYIKCICEYPYTSPDTFFCDPQTETCFC